MYPPAGLEAVLQKMHQDYEDNPYSSPMGAQVQSGDDLQGILNGINAQYAPQHQFSDKLAELISQFPQRQPHTKMQEFMANLASIHPSAMGISGGQPVGFMTDPAKFEATKDQMLNGPFYDAMNDWQAKIKPVEAGAQDERYINTNLRQLLGTQGREAIAAKRAEDQARNIDSLTAYRGVQGDAATTRAGAAVTNADAAATRAAGANTFEATDPSNGIVYVVNKGTGEAKPVQKKGLSTLQGGAPLIQQTPDEIAKSKMIQAAGLQGLKNTGAMNVQGLRNQGALAAANARNTNAQTNADRRLQDQKDLATFRANLKENEPTSQEVTQMHSARKMLKQVDIVADEAKNLAERSDWGLIQSEIRKTAAKYNWAGSAEDIQRSADSFALNLKSSNLPHDAAITQFAADLGFLASGMAYVHGQGRAGSSPAMINNMKELLSSGGEFSAFMGRLGSAKSLLNIYAAGPKGGVDSDIKSAVDDIIKAHQKGSK